jgi:hypothetical protein
MGQQSVGKSFSLNHLVDTSFAGSAMRTTGTAVHHVAWKFLNPVHRGHMDVSDTNSRGAHRGARL